MSVAAVNSALDNGTWQDLYTALCNPVLKLPVNITNLAAPLYYEEMKADKLECGVRTGFAFKYIMFILLSFVCTRVSQTVGPPPVEGLLVLWGGCIFLYERHTHTYFEPNMGAR